LANVAGLSAFHFSRAFKESFGLPPHRYLTSRRMDRAKELLSQADISVTEIGLELGFSNTSSFSAAFHKHTGTTPSWPVLLLSLRLDDLPNDTDPILFGQHHAGKVPASRG
jgi:AraC family transcriptional regulator